MLTALLVQPKHPLVYRHRCSGPCPHSLLQTDRWTTLSGIVTPLEPFEVPEHGFMLTRFSSPERYFAHQSQGLSLKAVLSGQEQFEIDHGLYRLEPGQTLVMNAGRDYGSLIPGEVTHTFCVSFGVSLAAELRGGWNHPLESEAQAGGVEVLERIYGPGSSLFGYLLELEQLSRDVAALEIHQLEEAALLLLAQVFEQDHQSWVAAERLTLQNPAQRREVYQRLERARDSMESTWNGREGLEDWAGVAGMSRFHFLRLFKAVFQETPRQYVIRRRLERAAIALREQPDQSVLEIALSCGFESASHFSTAFRQAFGNTPQAWRAKL